MLEAKLAAEEQAKLAAPAERKRITAAAARKRMAIKHSSKKTEQSE